MTQHEFLCWAEKNSKRVTEYKLGCDGSRGPCDCIGLLIGAWRMAGNSWPWTHGSNYAAKYLTNNLQKDAPLHEGDIVYKAHKPGERGYKLPDRYKNHKDQNDYYHVGIVKSVEPLCIMHCTSGSGCKVYKKVTVDGTTEYRWEPAKNGGIKFDTKRGNWAYSGQFNKLTTESGGGTVQDIMYVTSPNGAPVNLRRSASKEADLVTRIPVGQQVSVIGEISNGWYYISWGKYKGYIMAKYLTGGEQDQNPPETDEGGVLWQLVKSARDAIEQAMICIDDAKIALQALEELKNNE